MSQYPSSPHSVDSKAHIYEDKEGRLWVTHEELLACGYLNISDFDIVYLNGVFFELQGYARKPKAWWLEVVNFELKEDNGEEAPESESEAHEAAEG